MFSATYKPQNDDIQTLQRFFALAGPGYLDLPKHAWPSLLGLSEAAYHQLFEDLVAFGAIELTPDARAATANLNMIVKVLLREVPDYPGKRYVDLLAGLPCGDTVMSEAFRKGRLIALEGEGRVPRSALEFLGMSGEAGGPPYSSSRLSALTTYFWYLDYHLIRRQSFLDNPAEHTPGGQV